MTRRLGWVSGFLAAVAACAALAPVSASSAAVRAAKVFGDNMVLQQELPIAVWGTAEPGEQVSVELSGSKAAATKAGGDGSWRVELPAVKADGKDHTLTIKGPANSVELKNVLLGEVWLASGQSNMNRPDAIKDDVPGLRLLLRSRQKQQGPVPVRGDYGDDVQCTWAPATPAGVAAAPQTLQKGGKIGPNNTYPRVAYVFARTLHDTLKVPVGIMAIPVGGSTAKAWIPQADIDKTFPFDKPAESKKAAHEPGLMFQSQLRPVVGMTIRGIIWYQGEDDGRNKEYAKDFTELIASWRKLWNRPDLPFYFVQTAPCGYAGGTLLVWPAQVEVFNTVPNTGLAVSNDINDNGGPVPADAKLCKGKGENDPDAGLPVTGSSNPHPPHVDLVAGRLAQIALVKLYGQPERPIFGPIYDSSTIDGNKIVVKFKYACDGLKTSDGKAPTWFQISDGTKERNNLKFVKAEAKIVGKDTVEVWSPDVKNPRFVRFAWNTNARHNLVNSGNLPAVLFNTGQ